MDVILQLSRHFHCKSIYHTVVPLQKSVFVDNSSIILAHMSPFMENSPAIPVTWQDTAGLKAGLKCICIWIYVNMGDLN